MVAFIYLVLTLLLGYSLFCRFLPRLASIMQTVGSLRPGATPVPNWMVVLPGAWVTGILLMNWTSYMGAWFAATRLGLHNPLLYGNGLAITLAALAWLALNHKQLTKPNLQVLSALPQRLKSMGRWIWRHRGDFTFALLALLLSGFLMFYTFGMKGNAILVGGWVHSDFSPHLSVIRSFSVGENFPTEYPHFANGRMQYHFMFQFLAGNLEFMGFPIHWAFNIPSLLSLAAFFMLFYAFGFIITGYRMVGVLASIFVLLRSGMAGFIFLQKSFFDPVNGMRFDQLPAILNKIWQQDLFLGFSSYEEWGLWCLPSIFVNQRHLCLGLCVLILCLLYAVPMLMTAKQNEPNGPWPVRFFKGIGQAWASRDAWPALNIGQAVCLGILLGLTSYHNGSAVLGTLVLLFFTAWPSRHKLEFIVIAAISLALTFSETTFFMGLNTHKVFHPMWRVGLFATDRTPLGILGYFSQVFSVLPLLALLGCLALPKGWRWWGLVFMTPALFGSLIQFSPDLAQNHKFVHMTVILFNLVAAQAVYTLYTSRRVAKAGLAILLVSALTFTGLIDAITFIRGGQRYSQHNMEDPLLYWVMDYTAPNARFLTSNISLHPILLGGRKLFLGWQYFPWSAGYDTPGRDIQVNRMYSATDIDELRKLLQINRIDYVLVDDTNRNNRQIPLNEGLFRDHFKVAYEDYQKRITIFQVKNPSGP